MSSEMRNRATYEAFARAWSEKDVSRLMELVTDDIVYGASVGPEPGRTYRGRDEARQGFADILAYDSATGVHAGEQTFAEDRLYAEWAYDTADGRGGTRLTRGIDVIEFRDGRISLKQAFRKAPAQARAEVPASALPLAPTPAPYAPRRFASLGVWDFGDFKLKAYGIKASPEPAVPLLPADVIEAARTHAGERLSAAGREGGHYGLGYAILHSGIEANWLLVDWWAHADIGCQLLSSSTATAPAIFAPVTRPLMACVWELIPIGHERNAWVRHMLKPVPDRAGYLADRLADGVY
ncbi:Ketosteroid isomerase-related protein [Rhizobiales bacterium GAS188]|nr:Ketosteroid isomerase-related protein [Rhizobiales bacterium GAS188]